MRVRASLVYLGGVLAIGIPFGIVLADQVTNDLDASVDAALEVMNLTTGGADGTVNYTIVTQNGDGKNGCNFTGATSLVVGVNTSDSGVATVSPTSLTFTACGDVKTVSVTPVGAGSADITLSQTSNSTSGSFDLAPASFTVNVTTPPTNGHIVIDKIVDPSGDSQSFSFDAVGGTYADFSLTDADTPNDQGLVAGSYSVSETVPSGWDQTSADCVSSNGDTETVENISLQAGEIVTCTFLNTKRGHIIVEKVALPDGDPTVFDFNVTGTDYDPFSLSDGQSDDQELAPGTYSVEEVLPAGWDNAYECNGDATVEDNTAINLDPGETVTCVFKNVKRGHIIVEKVALPDGDPTVFDFNVTGTDYDPFSLSDGQSDDQELAPGTYSVEEVLPAGWDNAYECNGDATVEDNTAINLDPGETVTCVFKNVKRGHIIVEKQTDPNGSVDLFSFTGDAAGSIADDGQISVEVSAGTYSSVEDAAGAWILASIVCDDANSSGDVPTRTATFTVEPGETVTCVFTNAKYVFAGFKTPVTISLKEFKKTSTIPVKFVLTLAGQPACGPDARLYVDGNAAVASGNSNTGNYFRCDPVGKQYIFNLSTKQMTVGTHTLRVDFDNGDPSQVIVIKVKA